MLGTEEGAIDLLGDMDSDTVGSAEGLIDGFIDLVGLIEGTTDKLGTIDGS